MNNSPVSQGNGSKMRRGLVLEGGGAKGAWQFGALQALDESGIKFDCVAGTSVGALNGALWAAGRLDLGKELWTSLSLSKVYKLRLHHSPMFVIGLFARIFYAYVKGFISPKHAPLSVRIVLRGLMSVPTIVAAIYLILVLVNLFRVPMNNGRLWLIPILAVIVAFVLAGFVLHRKEEGRQQYFLYTSYLALLALLVHLFFYVIGGRELTIKDGPALGFLIVNTALKMPMLLWVLAVIPLVIFCLARVLRRLNTSIFSVGPLQEVILNLLASKFKMPMFATVAREIHKYLDPDDLKYRHIEGVGLSEAITRSAITPNYLRVDKLSDEDALTTLLATSALPLGITPRRKGEHAVGPQELTAIREAEAEELSKWFPTRRLKVGSAASKAFLMDGGVVDNIPWHPFIEDLPCDEIVIVGCSPMPNWNDQETVEKMKEEWKDRARLLTMVNSSLEYPVDEAMYSMEEDGTVTSLEPGPSGFEPFKFGYANPVKNDPPQIVPHPEPTRWPDRVVIIAPKTKLGNFLTGTLNFSTRVAQERMKQGCKEARDVIKTSNLSQ